MGLLVPQRERFHSGWAVAVHFVGYDKSSRLDWQGQQAVLDAFAASGTHSLAAHQKKASEGDQAQREGYQVAVAHHYVGVECAFVEAGSDFVGKEVVNRQYTAVAHLGMEAARPEIVVDHRFEIVVARSGTVVDQSGIEIHRERQVGLHSETEGDHADTGVGTLVRQVAEIVVEVRMPSCSGIAVVLEG